METKFNFQYLSLAYLNKRGKVYISGENYFISPLPANVCQKKENIKIDEIGDAQGFLWNMAFTLLESARDDFTKES
jgi:hypothetical protein